MSEQMLSFSEYFPYCLIIGYEDFSLFSVLLIGERYAFLRCFAPYITILVRGAAPTVTRDASVTVSGEFFSRFS